MADPARLIVLIALIGAVAGAFFLAELQWFRRASLADRLLPHAGAEKTTTARRSIVNDVITPFATNIGSQISGLLGFHESLDVRLRRANLPYDASAFRLKQFALSAGAFAAGLVAVAAIRPPFVLVMLFLLGGPILSFLVQEQQVSSAITKRQRSTFDELPLVAEQIAMLLGAGYSLNAALNRIADRLEGTAAISLRKVCDRIRHGLSVKDALREWEDDIALPELRRLVAVLSLTTETSDLGRLVSDEAANIRSESHRRLSETIDKRAQQVWIPVTVATLVPGVIFLCIPFLQALQLLSGT